MIPIELTKPSENEVLQAQKYAEYTTRMNYCRETHVSQDDLARTYGSVCVVPQDKEFVLNVFKGATEEDALRLQAYVQKIREGYWNSFPFQGLVGRRSGKRFYRLTVARSEPASGDVIIPCSEELCEEFGKYHLQPNIELEELQIHTGESIVKDNYRLQLVKIEGTEWTLDIETFRELTVNEAASFASDISWLAAEAKKGNGES